MISIATRLEVAAALSALREQRYSFANEVDLQRGIEMALKIAGIGNRREVRLAPADRIDFLLGNGVGIEVKIQSSLSALTRQLHRYAQSSMIDALILVTSKRQLTALPDTISGKAIHCFLASQIA